MIETIEQLIARLQKCDPKAKVTIYFNDRIDHIMEIGGDSHATKDVRIVSVKSMTHWND